MTNGSPSLVHTQQTTAENPPLPTYGQVLRRCCRKKFAAAMVIYKLMDASDGNFRAQRLEDCRQISWFTRHLQSGEVRVASSSCSLRWCPVCANVRRNFVTRSVADWLSNCEYPKLITLTLLHSKDDLRSQIDFLYKCFRKLRSKKEFSKAVTGGVWFFQIKKSKTDGCWHPHIHAVVTGDFFPRRRLSKIWLKITNGSMVTEIRAIKDPQGAANEVARYATSPGDLSVLAPDDGLEMVDALHGRRICGTWGTGRGISLRPKSTIIKEEWENIGSWQAVVGQVETSHDAKAIMHAWQTGAILGKDISCSSSDYWTERMKDPNWISYDYESIYDHERIPP